MARTGQDPNLDVLRSVAVLAVFLTHALQVIAGCAFGDRLAFGVDTYALGRIGVLIFFVHTSLVLMRSLERHGEGLSGWPLAGRFYIRRAFRIYPLSVGLILCCIAFSIPPNALGAAFAWHGMPWLAANILLVQNITGSPDVSSPLWSLPYEVQMYLVLPALFLLLRRSGMKRLASVCLIGALFGFLYPILRYVPCFLAGVFAYQLAGVVRPRVPSWLWLPVVTALVVAYVRTPGSDMSWLKDVVSCFTVGVLIPQFHAVNGAIAAAASRIARYSYGIYLCHTPVLWFSRELALSGWQRDIWLMLATGAVSVACYHAIERPMIAIGSRLADRTLTQPVAPVRAAAG